MLRDYTTVMNGNSYLNIDMDQTYAPCLTVLSDFHLAGAFREAPSTYHLYF